MTETEDRSATATPTTTHAAGQRPKGGIVKRWPPSRRLSLKSARFTIRSLEGEDVTEALWAWFDAPVFRRAFPSFQRMESPEAFKKRYALGGGSKTRTMLIKRSDRPIGVLWVVPDGPGRVIQTHNYVADPAWWGFGVIHEARAALMEGLFRLGAERIYGMPRADNTSAVRCYREQGFVEEGRMRNHYPGPEGKLLDALIFSYLVDEWTHARAAALPHRLHKKFAEKGVGPW